MIRCALYLHKGALRWEVSLCDLPAPTDVKHGLLLTEAWRSKGGGVHLADLALSWSTEIVERSTMVVVVAHRMMLRYQFMAFLLQLTLIYYVAHQSCCLNLLNLPFKSWLGCKLLIDGQMLQIVLAIWCQTISYLLLLLIIYVTSLF